eukprot:TRINITY_DN34434_c0_g1_i1.p1 TRINITY_DN34434_c0_g1~~TRINITY_DN34434_c0_g1_i1.p1  ORF type:complete len:249 (+),score=70.42 TRINITY_DN34434_c0_g1_i1:90-749(+)
MTTVNNDALTSQYLKNQQRDVSWEDALRRWKMRRQVKRYREYTRNGNEEAVKVTLSQYGIEADRYTTVMRTDPLPANRVDAKRKASNAHDFSKEEGGKIRSFKWVDKDEADAFVPEELLDIGMNQETSGDRRRRSIKERKEVSTTKADERKSRRRSEVEALTAAPSPGQVIREEREILDHDWGQYTDLLNKQKEAVTQQAAELEKMEMDVDDFNDVLSD